MLKKITLKNDNIFLLIKEINFFLKQKNDRTRYTSDGYYLYQRDDSFEFQKISLLSELKMEKGKKYIWEYEPQQNTILFGWKIKGEK